MSRENPVDGARHDARHPGLIATTGPASGPPALKPTVSRARTVTMYQYLLYSIPREL